MLQRLAILIILLSASAWCGVLVLERFDAAGNHLSSGDEELDEGWRRTTSGWERLAPRILVWRAINPRGTASGDGPEAPLAQIAPAARWDFHPAILALLLLSAVVIVFCMFPGRGKVDAHRRSQTLF
jgi:hypothetical protein